MDGVGVLARVVEEDVLRVCMVAEKRGVVRPGVRAVIEVDAMDVGDVVLCNRRGRLCALQ